MFKLFKKEIKPKVFAVIFTWKKNNEDYLRLDHGYTIEEVIKNIEKEYKGGFNLKEYTSIDLESVANKYSEENQSLQSLKK